VRAAQGSYDEAFIIALKVAVTGAVGLTPVALAAGVIEFTVTGGFCVPDEVENSTSTQ